MPVNDSEFENAAYSPCDHVVFTELDGDGGVLVDLNTRKYYQLNETATLIWRGLEQRFPLGAIAKEMTERYDVTLERATSSIENTLRNFDAQKLIGRR